MRRFLPFLLVILLFGGALATGVGAYNAGVDDGRTQALIESSTDDGGERITVIENRRGYPGFGAFFLLPFAFFFLLILAKVAWWGGRGRHRHHGHDGWHGHRHEQAAEFHRRLHEGEHATDAATSVSTGGGTGDGR